MSNKKMLVKLKRPAFWTIYKKDGTYNDITARACVAHQAKKFGYIIVYHPAGIEKVKS